MPRLHRHAHVLLFMFKRTTDGMTVGLSRLGINSPKKLQTNRKHHLVICGDSQSEDLQSGSVNFWHCSLWYLKRKQCKMSLPKVCEMFPTPAVFRAESCVPTLQEHHKLTWSGKLCSSLCVWLSFFSFCELSLDDIIRVSNRTKHESCSMPSAKKRFHYIFQRCRLGVVQLNSTTECLIMNVCSCLLWNSIEWF